MTIYIADQHVDMDDSKLAYQLANASPHRVRIVATLAIDIGGGQIIEAGHHSEAITNSAAGRARLAEYPALVQGWLIPGIWGDEPTVIEKEEENHEI